MEEQFSSTDVVNIFNQAGFADVDDAIACLRFLQVVNDGLATTGVTAAQFMAFAQNAVKLALLQTQLIASKSAQAAYNNVANSANDSTQQQISQLLSQLNPPPSSNG